MFSLASLGIREIVIVNRTIARAQLLASFSKQFPSIKFQVMGFEDSIPSDAKLYINATSIGLSGNQGRVPLPQQVKKGSVAFEMVYGNEPTAFQVEAEKLKLPCIEGLDMLIWQAFKTFEIWFKKLEHPLNLKIQLKSHIVAERRK